MRKKLLVGTTNRARVEHLRASLFPLPLYVVTPWDLGIDIHVEEDGTSPKENAEKKARTYFTASSIPTISMDASLFIDKFIAERQPGMYVRRIHGSHTRPTDEEILAYYIEELRKIGGESAGKWEVAMTLMCSPHKLFYKTYELEALFISLRSKTIIRDAPLRSIMVDLETGTYFSEIPDSARHDALWVREFVGEHIEEL